jgi:hypothetical protein
MYDEHVPAIALQGLFDLPQGGDNAIDLWAPGVGYEEEFHRWMRSDPRSED